jgi:hypothetical protein
MPINSKEIRLCAIALTLGVDRQDGYMKRIQVFVHGFPNPGDAVTCIDQGLDKYGGELAEDKRREIVTGIIRNGCSDIRDLRDLLRTRLEDLALYRPTSPDPSESSNERR